MDDKSLRIRTPKRWIRIALIVGVTTALVVPLTAIASHSFTDVPDSNVFHGDIEWLADADVTRGCNPPANTEFCPTDNVTRGQMAAFLARALGLPPANSSFDDTVGHTFQAEIAALAAAGITKGCNPPDNTQFCPNQQVTRGQMAAFLRRALELSAADSSFVDVAGSVFESDIGALAAAGVTRGCNPPSNTFYCPDDHVTRGQMAAFLHRAIEGISGPTGPSVVMTGDGLGIADWADPMTATVTALTSVLGPPDEDSGWVAPVGFFGVCPGDAVRGIRWSHLWVLFVRSTTGVPIADLPPGDVFFSFTMNINAAVGSPQPPLTTDRGIGVGDTVGELRAAYGSAVSISHDDIFGWGYITADGLVGSVEGPEDTDLVEEVTAGATFCGE